MELSLYPKSRLIRVLPETGLKSFTQLRRRKYIQIRRNVRKTTSGEYEDDKSKNIGVPHRVAAFAFPVTTARLPAQTLQCVDTNVIKFFQPPNVDLGPDVKDSRQNIVLADDFRCTSTGPITDIHLWGSWLNDAKGVVTNFWIGIYNDVPAVTNFASGIITPSHPGSNLLWHQSFRFGAICREPICPGTGIFLQSHEQPVDRWRYPGLVLLLLSHQPIRAARHRRQPNQLLAGSLRPDRRPDVALRMENRAASSLQRCRRLGDRRRRPSHRELAVHDQSSQSTTLGPCVCARVAKHFNSTGGLRGKRLREISPGAKCSGRL